MRQFDPSEAYRAQGRHINKKNLSLGGPNNPHSRMGMNDQKRLTQVTGITFNPQSSMETPIGGLASSSGNGNVITSQNLNYEDSIAMHS